MGTKIMCSRLHDLEKIEWVTVDYDKNTCSSKSQCKADCGFQMEAEGLNQEEVKGLNRVKEIIRLAHKLKWVYSPNETSYPLMQLSEVEKCMLAMYNDFDLNRMRKWVEETQSSEQDKEAEG